MIQEVSKPVFDTDRMRYETPPGGISLGEYVARRLHKTRLLTLVPNLVAHDSAAALAQIGLYAVAGSTSFGPALYRPVKTTRWQVIDTTDPDTGARVRVVCEDENRFSFGIEMQGVGTLVGTEQTTGTTMSLHGLGMPTPCTFDFEAAEGDYTARLQGVITVELTPLVGRQRVRGFGALQMSDSAGNRGTVVMNRDGIVTTVITTPDGQRSERHDKLVE